MTYLRLAYDDADSAVQMHADCRIASMQLPRSIDRPGAADLVVGPAPSIAFEDYPREIAKRGGINVTEATARLAAAMQLHLD